MPASLIVRSFRWQRYSIFANYANIFSYILDKKAKNMENRVKLQIIIDHFCESKAEFCRMCKIGKSTLSSWISRNSIDYKLVADTFPEISAEWLLRDKEPMVLESYKKCEEQKIDKAETSSVPATSTGYDTSDSVVVPKMVLQAILDQLSVKDTQINALIASNSK